MIQNRTMAKCSTAVVDRLTALLVCIGLALTHFSGARRFEHLYTEDKASILCFALSDGDLSPSSTHK